MLQLASTVVLARLLAPEDFGVYAMVVAIAGLAALLSDFGFSMAALQSVGITAQQKSNLFWLNVTLGLTAGLLIFASSDLIAGLYARPEVSGVAKVIASLYVMQAASSMFRAELSRHFQFGYLAKVDVLAQALALGVAIGIALSGGGYWALVSQQLLVGAVVLVLLAAKSPWRPGLPKRVSGMKSLAAFGLNTGGVQLVNYLSSNVDTIALGRVWGAGVVGLYSQAFLLFRIPLQQLAAPMTQVAVPVLSKISDKHQFEAYVLRAQLVLTYALGGAFLTSIAVSTPLFFLVLGPGWSGADQIYSVLAIGGIFQTLGYVYYWVFLSKSLTWLQLRIALVSRSLMIGFILLGLPWGSMGVAAGSSVGLAVNWVLLSIFGLPKAGLRFQKVAGAALRPLAVFGSVCGVVYCVSRFTDGLIPPLPQLIGLLLLEAVLLTSVYAASNTVRIDVRTILHTARLAMNRKGKL